MTSKVDPPQAKSSRAPAGVVPAGAESKIALLLSWIMPGAGQLYLGHARRALFFFLLVCVPFAVGMILSGGLAVEMARFHWGSHRIPLIAALAVIPEMLAYVPTMLAGSMVEAGWVYNPLDPGAGIAVHLGYVLTGTAGILAAFGMADAHHRGRVGRLLRPDQKDSILACGLTWLVPGLGHWYLGQRAKGVVVFLAIAMIFFLGLAFSGFACVQRGENYFYWAGQILCGAMAIITSLVTAGWSVDGFLDKGDLGLLLTTSAGLLNVLLMINAYTVCERLCGRESRPGTAVEDNHSSASRSVS